MAEAISRDLRGVLWIASAEGIAVTGQERMFFSEEKNQKTFVPVPIQAAASPTAIQADIGLG